jgi:hypothetical protein
MPEKDEREELGASGKDGQENPTDEGGEKSPEDQEEEPGEDRAHIRI